ncbi:MAG: DEAD/DEAH box helicase, partial [Candidatus Kapabacteria bacterium]|nr:DEAD/DEAH box helicase [Candidatus Kapabacteria bacterium]
MAQSISIFAHCIMILMPEATPHTSPQSAPKEPSQPVSPIQYMKGIGPRRAEALALAGILTSADLLRFYPRAYIDRNSVPSLRDLRTALMNAQQQDAFSEQNINLQTEITVVVFVRAVRDRTFGKNRTMVVIELDDNSGAKAEIVFWNQAEYFKRVFEPDQVLAVSGVPEYSYGKIQFHHPEIERIDPEDADLYSDGKILPKYRLTQKMKDAGLTMRVMRNLVAAVIEQEIPNLEETLSDELLEKFEFPGIRQAARQLHFPDSHEALAKARERMKFEELFFFELLLAMRHNGVKSLDVAPSIAEKSPLARTLLELLPFDLTKAQKRVLREIVEDMRSTKPMNRLLQGDVGSGKTVVALLAMLAAIDAGLQCVLMAPTEILAEQHYNTLRDYCDKLNNHFAETETPQKITVAQLVGGQKKRQRNEVSEKILSGEANIIVGTHALFQSTVEYKRLGLVVIDEQHRFGVLQRAELKKKATASFAGEIASSQNPTVAQTFLSVQNSQKPQTTEFTQNTPQAQSS